MASLRLTVPAQTDIHSPDVETRPAQLQDWLEDLPYVDIAEATGLVLAAVSRLNRYPLTPQARFGLLELYNKAYQQIGGLVYGGAGDPGSRPPDKGSDCDELVRRLSVEMAFGYKIAVNDSLGQKKLWGKNKALAAAIQRAVHFLGQILVTHFLSHARPPNNVWREIYQLYRYAEEHQFLELAIKEPPGPGGDVPGTIAGAFKQILLIGLSDPYAVPRSELLDICNYLRHYADHAAITPAEPVASPAAHFVIDLESDHRPDSYQQAGETADAKHCRLLKTARLIHTIEQHLEALRSGEGSEIVGLPVPRSMADTARMLEHLKTAWGAAAMRRYRRQTDQGQVNIATGIKAVYYFLNGCNPFDPRKYLEPVDEDSIDLGKQTQSFARIGSRTFDKHPFAIANISAGGIALRAPVRANSVIQVGQIVGLEQPGNGESGSWSVGVVRWFHECGPREIELGIEFLAPHAQPTALRARAGSPVDTEFQEALLLSGEDGRDQPHDYVLVAASGLYLHDRTLVADFKAGTLEMRAQRHIESTPFFDHFRARAVE